MMSALNTQTGEQDKTLDTDTIHELLSNSRRRAVLRILDREGELDKGKLSSLVAADEYGKAIDELTSDERKRVHISIHQQHKDKLEDARVIESNGTIQLTERADELLWHLEGKPEESLCDTVRQFVSNLY